MLIRALSDYYDILSAAGKVLPKGYSKVKVQYLIAVSYTHLTLPTIA